MSTKRVLAAVSGGVDSSVAVHLLRQQGYEVEGVILEFSPAHRAAVESARVIAEQMKMPLHVIECHREFEENVILPFCREYREGRTPNPCILCNLPSSAKLRQSWDLISLRPVTTPGSSISPAAPLC